MKNKLAFIISVIILCVYSKVSSQQYTNGFETANCNCNGIMEPLPAKWENGSTIRVHPNLTSTTTQCQLYTYISGYGNNNNNSSDLTCMVSEINKILSPTDKISLTYGQTTINNLFTLNAPFYESKIFQTSKAHYEDLGKDPHTEPALTRRHGSCDCTKRIFRLLGSEIGLVENDGENLKWYQGPREPMFWSWYISTSGNIQNWFIQRYVMLHELGHHVGLDHQTDKLDTMLPSVKTTGGHYPSSIDLDYYGLFLTGPEMSKNIYFGYSGLQKNLNPVKDIALLQFRRGANANTNLVIQNSEQEICPNKTNLIKLKTTIQNRGSLIREVIIELVASTDSGLGDNDDILLREEFLTINPYTSIPKDYQIEANELGTVLNYNTSYYLGAIITDTGGPDDVIENNKTLMWPWKTLKTKGVAQCP